MRRKWWKVGLIGVLLVSALGWWVYKYYGVNPFRSEERVRVLYTKEFEEAKNGVSEIPYQVEEVVRDLYVPWSIVFTSPSRMLLTERSGTVRVVENGVLRDRPLVVFEEVSTQSEEGLMGMAMHPNYAANRFLYFSVAYEEGGEMFVKVVRLYDNGEMAVDDKVIIDKIPAARLHAGSRVKFGPDGKLYVTTGDATDRQLAQNKNNLIGKILRMNDDGSIPDDNPDPNSYVYSYGHRNPQGIAWQPITNRLFETEHGPSGFDGPGGGDEMNLIVPGANYGWPVVSHEKSAPGMVDPLITWTPAVAPASAMFYTANVFPQFKGDFFFGGLRGEGLFRVVMGNGGDEVVEWERLDEVNVGRVREVMQGPDGLIYFTTSNRDGRGQIREGDDKVYRLVPASQ